MKLTANQWNNVVQREDKISQVLHRKSTQRPRYWQPQPLWMGRICFWESDATAFPRLWPRSLLILPNKFLVLETELHSFCINFRKSLEKPALPQKKKCKMISIAHYPDCESWWIWVLLGATQKQKVYEEIQEKWKVTGWL